MTDAYLKGAKEARGIDRIEACLRGVKGISGVMNAIAALALSFVMLLTAIDVVLRIFGIPIVGTYELVGFMGGVIVGFAIPMTSWDRAHIYVDLAIRRLSRGKRETIIVSTRMMAIAFFAIAGINLFRQGYYLRRTGEVSPTLQLPFYPVVFGIGLACVVECLVLAADIVKSLRDGHGAEREA